jgi:hypothetical protein
LASFDGDNLERLCDAMRELNARIRAEGFSDAEAISVAPTMLHPDTFRHAELTTWQTDAGPLDVLHDGRSSEGNLGGIRVRVAALDDIVASKEWANRPKDHEALDELHTLQQRDRMNRERNLDQPAQRSPQPPDRGVDL